MGLALPLAVRLKTVNADRHVTRDLRDLTFRSVAPGGFASAAFSFDRPLDIQPTEVDYYSNVYVYDKRSGATVWEGRLEDPGRSAADGEIWRVTAVGGSAHAQDRTVPLIYVDQSITDGWVRRPLQGNARIDVSVTGDPAFTDDSQAIVIVFREATGQVQNDRGDWMYRRIDDAGMSLARFDYTWNAGVTSANFSIDALTHPGVTGAATTARTQTWNVAGGASNPKKLVTDFPVGDSVLDLRAIFTAASGGTYAADRWCSVANVIVIAMRKDKTGADLNTAGTYGTNYVLASDVVADLLGRLLNKYDGANAAITTTSTHIDSLAYPDGINPAGVLDDLMLLEPGYFWAAWESNTAGLYRFEWSAWPTTTVRYEATTVDGFDSPGSAVDLWNAVQVRYVNVTNKTVTVRRTAAVAALTNAGLTREALLDITSLGPVTTFAAQTAGDQWLTQHAVPPNAGTLIVARPLPDLTNGAAVQPWEIRPGNLIRVRGVLPRVDALNPTDRDGVTVFRITAVDFDAATCTARLELDSSPISVAQMLGKFRRKTFGGGGVLR